MLALVAPAASRAGDDDDRADGRRVRARRGARRRTSGPRTSWTPRAGSPPTRAARIGSTSPGAAYSYLKFDLSDDPGRRGDHERVELELTSRTGYAWDGDPDQHLRFVGDDAWTRERDHVRQRARRTSTPQTSRRGRSSTRRPRLRRPEGRPAAADVHRPALTSRVDVGARRRRDALAAGLQPELPDAAGTAQPRLLGAVLLARGEQPQLRPQLRRHLRGAAAAGALRAPSRTRRRAAPRPSGSVTRPRRRPATRSTSTPAPRCKDGVLGRERSFLGSHHASHAPTRPATAYFAQTLDDALPAGLYVAATDRGPDQVTHRSRAASSRRTTTPGRARCPLSVKRRPAQVTQSLDYDGQARWYRFDVAPDSQVTLDLDGLPANYDLFVFKDIAAALEPRVLGGGPAEAERRVRRPPTARRRRSRPSAFSPSAFTPVGVLAVARSARPRSRRPRSARRRSRPSAFSPSAFSPSAFSPSAFSPVRVLALGLQPRRLLERADPQPDRRLDQRGHRGRAHHAQQLGQHAALRPRQRPPRRLERRRRLTGCA